MDATAGVRDYFYDKGFHNYDTQAQGQEAKVMKSAYFVRSTALEPASASLYRPKTKSGDPRLWFSKLKEYAAPYNLLAVLVHEDAVYVINCSDPDVLDSINRPNTPLGAISSTSKPTKNPLAEELLEMIRAISAKGFIPR